MPAAPPSPPRTPALRPRLDPEEQRIRLMRAAMTRFAVDGYSSATVASIVAEARMSRTTFYRHFSDREDVLVACLDHLLDAVVEVLRETVLATVNQPDRQVEIVSTLLEVVASNQAFAPVLLMETIGGSARATARLWEVLDALSELLTASDRLAEQRHGRPQLRLPLAETALVGALYMWICAHIRGGTFGEVAHDADVARLVVEATQSARAAIVAPTG